MGVIAHSTLGVNTFFRVFYETPRRIELLVLGVENLVRPSGGAIGDAARPLSCLAFPIRVAISPPHGQSAS